MEVLHARCAGLDVHKDTVVAGMRLAGGGSVKTEVRSFGTTTPDLLALSAWLAEIDALDDALSEIDAEVERGLDLSCTRFLWTPICPRRDRNDDVHAEADRRSFGR
jgi:hypothetical protein